jgi:hypothetical protein
VGFEETRRLIAGEAGGAKIRGNPELHRRFLWRMRDSKKLGA